MALRPEILEVIQVGKETTLGTAVAANKKLLGLKWDFDPKIPVEIDRAQGTKSPVGTVVGKEHTEIGISGNASASDLLYLLATLLEAPTITAASARRCWAW